MPPSDTRTNLRSSEFAIDLASDVLPTPGGPAKQRIGPFMVGLSFAHRQIFEDSILRLLESGVIGVEHGLGPCEVDDFVRALGPRQRNQPVDICARDGVFRGCDRHLRQAIELALGLLLYGLRHAGRFDFLAQLFDFLGLIVALAQLLLYRLHLLAQEVFALVLADLRLDLGLDLRAQLEHFGFLDQEPVQQIEARAHVDGFEHLLLHRRAQRRKARRDEVGEPARLGNVHRQRLQIVGQQRRQRDDMLEVGFDVPLQRVDLESIFVAHHVVGRC